MINYTQEQIIAESERRRKLTKEYVSSPEYKEKIINRLKIADACASSIQARAHTWKQIGRAHV